MVEIKNQSPVNGTKYGLSTNARALLDKVKPALYSESAIAKVWGVAVAQLDQPHPPTEYPHHSFGKYSFVPPNDWTSGFFPGSIYVLLERAEKHPEHFPSHKINQLKLHFAARWWADNMKPQAARTDTHDLGFMIEPSFRREYELFGSKYGRETVIKAAYSLATRYDENIGAIKSWDRAMTKSYDLGDHNGDFLVIIDNLMNLNMLYWAAAETGDISLSTIATAHAETALNDAVRHPVWSTYHVVNYDSVTGKIRKQMTHQGWEDESCWSRGQAWAIHGFADVYKWTMDRKFLTAACELAKYFMSRVGTDGVPAWDFDAPQKDVKDTSAAMIAAEGMIKIYMFTEIEEYLVYGLQLVHGAVQHCLGEEAVLNMDGSTSYEGIDTILTDATQNFNPDAMVCNHSHGLVYADYYFLQIGNALLGMGLV